MIGLCLVRRGEINILKYFPIASFSAIWTCTIIFCDFIISEQQEWPFHKGTPLALWFLFSVNDKTRTLSYCRYTYLKPLKVLNSSRSRSLQFNLKNIVLFLNVLYLHSTNINYKKRKFIFFFQWYKFFKSWQFRIHLVSLNYLKRLPV